MVFVEVVGIRGLGDTLVVLIQGNDRYATNGAFNLFCAIRVGDFFNGANVEGGFGAACTSADAASGIGTFVTRTIGPIGKGGGMGTFSHGVGFVESGVADSPPITATGVVAVVIVAVGGTACVGYRMGASIAGTAGVGGTVAVITHIGFVGDVTQQVVADGFSGLPHDLVAG